MQPCSSTRGFRGKWPAALRAVDLVAHAIGDDGDVPPRGSTDEVNIAWCAARGAVLVTNDRGKKDKTIFNHLATHHVHAISSTTTPVGDPHRLLRAILLAEEEMDHSRSDRAA